MAYEKVLTLSNLHLQPGTLIEVEGFMQPNPERFSVELGTSDNDVILHFNPRFNNMGDINTIVCNSVISGKFGTEERFKNFPFEGNKLTKLWFTFNGASGITVKLQNQGTVSFPNQTTIGTITYMTIHGNIDVKGIWFHYP
ncbi:galectin-1-like [Protopterus annectens]|uniref:galectin-1-like n=1 Tax=Protopterus annectens TaxID=7888 RepID=UPI001CFB96B2|nr:galectin-1-like [Protopterus annectens]